MKQWIRSYALGLFTAVLIFTIIYLNTDDPSSTSAKMSDDPDELIQQLEEKGYQTLTNEEWNALKESSKQQKTTSPPAEDPVKTFSMDITPGTTTDEISDKLVNAQIIEDAAAFESFMQDNDYSRYIQIGQATLNSQMSLQEIAEAITSK